MSNQVTLLRQEIADAIKEFASPIDVREPGYRGPSGITDAPVVVVLDASQGGLPASERSYVTHMSGSANSHDEEILAASADERLVRWIAIRMENQDSITGTVTEMQLQVRSPGGSALIIARAVGRTISVGAEIWIASHSMEIVDDSNGARASGSTPIPRNIRLAPGETMHFSATTGFDSRWRFEFQIDSVPKGVYLSI